MTEAPDRRRELLEAEAGPALDVNSNRNSSSSTTHAQSMARRNRESELKLSNRS
jgi:hypothetical protein